LTAAVRKAPLWTVVLLLSMAVMANTDVTLNTGDLEAWQEKTFRGRTQYQVVQMEQRPALRSRSKGSASALYMKRRIDLAHTPYLSWSWRVDKLPDTANERTRRGDDYAARVYVVIDGGWMPWRSNAVNYVWANQMPAGSEWDNAYAGDRVKMVALRSANDGLERWFHEKRNVREDLYRLHGIEVRYIDGIAIMTDSDDSGSAALAYYADIGFSSD
jgi:hypothetical protein